MYRLSSGESRCYFATDNLRAPQYVGLSPSDFFDFVRRHRLYFDSEAKRGPVFSMVGAMSEFGRLGATCIAETPEAATAMYEGIVKSLDEECADGGGWWRVPTHPVGLPIARME